MTGVLLCGWTMGTLATLRANIPLFLAGLLAFLLLFLPYTLLLLFGQCIEAGSNHKLLSWANNLKVRSFLDAYHAPYNNRHRYWTGLLLVLRFVLFIISAGVIDINSPRDPSINFLVLGSTCIGLAAWIWNTGSMYRKWYTITFWSHLSSSTWLYLLCPLTRWRWKGGTRRLLSTLQWALLLCHSWELSHTIWQNE